MTHSISHRPPGIPSWALYLCFFLSGIAGLTYEIVWSKYLALFMGSTGEAHVIILSTYMGGLAIGAWWFGRRADRSPNPLRLYVALELGIGLMGLLYPRLFEPVRALFIAAVRVFGLGSGALHFSAVLVCVLTLLPPTILMGGTLPVLGRHMIRSQQSIGQRIASLYYLNSFGAVLGSLVAGFWLIRSVGLEFSLIVAGLLNLFVAALAFLASQIYPEVAEVSQDELLLSDTSPLDAARASFGDESRRLWNPARIAVIVIGISGVASMIYEVAWIRLLALVLGSSSFSFSLMLAAFISGITLGSFLLSFKKSDSGYYRILGWCELAIGLTALVSIYGYQHLPIVLNHWRTSLTPSEHTYALFQVVQFSICFMVMVVPTIFMGATVPAASRVVAEGMEGLGRKIGNVFAINTAGTLIGAAVAGFVMLPWLGIRHTIEVAVALNLLLGLWVLMSDSGPSFSRLFNKATAWLFALGIPALYLILSPEWDRKVFAAATYRSRVRIESIAHFKSLLKDRKFAYYKDGADATIAVSDDADGTRALLINGKPDASTTGDMLTQLMVGHLPMLMHPDPENVLVVGLGAGISAGATTLYDSKLVHCVELIPEVVEAASHFAEYNHDITHHPTAKIFVQDAKTFLQVTPEKYDVIVNQPTNLWISGVAGLFTTEYFQACRERMKSGGLFILWIQAYELPDPTMFSILRTFNETFPYSTFFNLNGMDVAVVGSIAPFDPDFARMEQRLANPKIAADLSPFGVRGILPILSMQMATKSRTPGPYVEIGGVNSDFFPTLEHEAARGFFIGADALGLKQLDQRFRAPGRGGLWFDQYVSSSTPPELVFSDYFRHIERYKPLNPDVLRAWVDLWARFYPDSPAMLLARGRLRDENELWRLDALRDERLALDPAALVMKSGLLSEQYESERNFIRLPDSTELKAVLNKLLGVSTQRVTALIGLGDLALDERTPEIALDHYLEAAELTPERSLRQNDIALRIAETHLDLNQIDQAAEILLGMHSPSLESRIAFRHHLLNCRLARIRLTE